MKDPRAKEIREFADIFAKLRWADQAQANIELADYIDHLASKNRALIKANQRMYNALQELREFLWVDQEMVAVIDSALAGQIL